MSKKFDISMAIKADNSIKQKKNQQSFCPRELGFLIERRDHASPVDDNAFVTAAITLVASCENAFLHLTTNGAVYFLTRASRRRGTRFIARHQSTGNAPAHAFISLGLVAMGRLAANRTVQPWTAARISPNASRPAHGFDADGTSPAMMPRAVLKCGVGRKSSKTDSKAERQHDHHSRKHDELENTVEGYFVGGEGSCRENCEW